MTTPDPYLWDEIKVQNFRSKIAENPVAPCLLPCPDRRGLVNGLYALVDRLTDENTALVDEVEEALAMAQEATQRANKNVPDSPGNDK